MGANRRVVSPQTFFLHVMFFCFFLSDGMWTKWVSSRASGISSHMNNVDHGHRFAQLRATHQGQLEERLPFYSLTLPKTLRDTDEGAKVTLFLLVLIASPLWCRKSVSRVIIPRWLYNLSPSPFLPLLRYGPRKIDFRCTRICSWTRIDWARPSIFTRRSMTLSRFPRIWRRNRQA